MTERKKERREKEKISCIVATIRVNIGPDWP